MDKQHVAQRLAGQLTDEVLQEIFPDTAPQIIRDLLLDKRTTPSPPPAATGGRERTKEPVSCRLFTDGASRGNPSPAGAGVVLFDDQGREICTRAKYLGRCTNNVAEYQALIIGLQAAREIGCRQLAIFLDSELIVRQITGRYKVKNATLKPLFAKVQSLLQGFDGYTVAHVPRARNSRADELANRGIDEKHRG
ncbi:MAG: ribonuclease HI family protein [Desulfobulbaceae bacterium]|nr:ribonuclease HI family protein [Desulfobulbaceae bacterium]